MANEERLIDANALKDEFRRHMAERYDREKCVSEENCKTCDRVCLWQRTVNNAPTVDAVEVVYCKDCTEWGKYPHEETGDCNSHNCRVGANEFCSRGTRRKHEKM